MFLNIQIEDNVVGKTQKRNKNEMKCKDHRISILEIFDIPLHIVGKRRDVVDE